ncbi:hypothetical protein PsorP6_006117 [Peronosclerospora sorghi]|uniref:Uncharacterized protein n=1 Tax=Peronosclerospora sorghi TaxID=230839 RepID=A0ACC0W5Y6_9STRA|nr:hypothetical protein PsorP6_006117 [Peronosclerospora sorghi]
MPEPPTEAVHASLEEAEATLIEHVRSQGFAVTRTRTKKSKTGLTRKVWFGYARGGAYKNRRDYLTEETRKRKTSTRASGCPNGENDDNDAAAAPAYNWTTTVEVAGHNHGEAELRKAQHFGDAAAQCTNAFTRKMGLPCAHRIRDILATTGHLKMEDFSDYWWLSRRRVHAPAHIHPGDAVQRVSQMEQALTCIQVRHVHLSPHQQKIIED